MYFNLCFYGKAAANFIYLHMLNSVIVLIKSDHIEVWSKLTEVCKAHKFSYTYLKGKKYPFVYRGITFQKVPYKMKTGIF